MSLKIDYVKMSNKDEAYTKVKEFITPDLIAKFNVKAEFDYNEADKKIKAKGKGFDFALDFQEDHVNLDLKLSLLLKPLKGKVLDALERQVNKII
jgi:hypothetical protein